MGADTGQLHSSPASAKVAGEEDGGEERGEKEKEHENAPGPGKSNNSRTYKPKTVYEGALRNGPSGDFSDS